VFPAFLDTCVLYGATVNDTFLRIAEQGAFQPYWSADVLDELQRNLVGRAGLSEERAARRIAHMRMAFPDAEVLGYEGLIHAMSCHPKDRHVLAATVQGRCEVLVTFNTKDFPVEALRGLNVSVLHPDAFLLDQVDLYPARVGRALTNQVRDSGRPRLMMGSLLASLARSGLPEFAAEVQRHEFTTLSGDRDE